MASKADRTALAIISLADGAVRELYAAKSFSRVDMMSDLLKLSSIIRKVRLSYSDNMTQKNREEVAAAIDRWAAYNYSLNLQKNLVTTIMVKLAVMSITDLLTVVKNKKRITALNSILEPLAQFDDFTDPMGNAFMSYEGCKELLTSFYYEIGFDFNAQ